MNFGDYIRELRGSRSQEAIGKLAGISGATLSLIESGERTDLKVSTLIAIAKALNTPVMNLILAYQGLDPEGQEELSQQEITDEIVSLLRKRGVL